MSDVTFINIADLTDPNDPEGRSYREVNNSRPHKIALGSLVESAPDSIRLYAVENRRDCDGTPMYVLGIYPDSRKDHPDAHRRVLSYGYSEDYLTVIKTLEEVEE